MGIVVAGFDVHRSQITFDALDRDSGEVIRGRIDSTPAAVAAWSSASRAARSTWPSRPAPAGSSSATRWPPPAPPRTWRSPPTRALRGKKRRAKTDREDARWLRTLLDEGRLPEPWIPPAHICERRTLTRLRKALIDERTAWLERIQATLFHHGVSGVPQHLRRARGRAFLARLDLPTASLKRIEVALAMVDASTASSSRSSRSCAPSPAARRAAAPSWATSGSAS